MTSTIILALRFLFAPRGLLNERHESFASQANKGEAERRKARG